MILSFLRLCIYFCLLLLTTNVVSSSSVNLNTAYTWTIDPALPFDEQILAFSFQGLANRDKARVWYYQPNFWTYNESTYYFPTWLTANKGFTFVNSSSFCDLYTSVMATGEVTINGLAVYNATELDSTRWLATASSGLSNFLPVSYDIYTNVTYNCIHSLPFRIDYRNRFTSNLDAYNWSITNLIPSCNRTMVYSAGHTYNDSTEYVYIGLDPAIDMGLDLAIALQSFVFNLSPDMQKYPAQQQMWENIVATLDPGKLIFGWAEPEPDMTYSASKVGSAVLCDAAPNFSFWTHIASSYPTLPYNSNPSQAVINTSKNYITFQTNEGDTPKILASLQGGMWLDPRRGSIPIAWGFNPLIAVYAPGLLEYYSLSATTNDTWFAATAGAGYAYPWLMNPTDFELYINRAASLIHSVTPSWPPNSFEIDIWDNNRLNNLTSYKTIAGTAVGMFSMQPEELPGTNNWLPPINGENVSTPVIIAAGNLWYPCQKLNQSTYDDMEQAIINLIGNQSSPFFTVIYGCLDMGNGLNMYDFAIEMQNRLGSSHNVEVVGMQDMVQLAQQASGLPHLPSVTDTVKSIPRQHRSRPKSSELYGRYR